MALSPTQIAERLTNRKIDGYSVDAKATRGILVDDTGATILGISNYQLQDLEEASATITYLGKEKQNGTYLIVKMDTTSGMSMRYGNVSNNSSYTSYTTAWSARASLTYELLEELTGI